MNTIQYGNLIVSFNRALDEVLGTYFDAGGTFSLMQESLDVHRCELRYNRDAITEVTDRPRIVFLGSRPTSVDERNSPGKCDNGSERVQVKRSIVERTVHVMVARGKSLPKPPYNTEALVAGDKQVADEVWSQLSAVLKQARFALRERGIYSASLDDFPQENSDDQWCINTGKLVATVEYAIRMEASL